MLSPIHCFLIQVNFSTSRKRQASLQKSLYIFVEAICRVLGYPIYQPGCGINVGILYLKPSDIVFVFGWRVGSASIMARRSLRAGFRGANDFISGVPWLGIAYIYPALRNPITVRLSQAWQKNSYTDHTFPSVTCRSYHRPISGFGLPIASIVCSWPHRFIQYGVWHNPGISKRNKWPQVDLWVALKLNR
jgi:hypothetical protein